MTLREIIKSDLQGRLGVIQGRVEHLERIEAPSLILDKAKKRLGKKKTAIILSTCSGRYMYVPDEELVTNIP